MDRKFVGDDEVSQVSTVGKAFSANQIYSVEHPEYKNFSRAVEEELIKISEREAGRRSTSQVLVSTTALTTEQVAKLSDAYPEFALRVVPLNNQVQSFWVASRLCANEWLSMVTRRYAQSVVHYGGSALSAVMQGRRGSHIELDASDDVMVNDDYTHSVDMHRLFGDYIRVQSEYQVLLPRSEYDDHLRGTAYNVCRNPQSCTHRADAMCVDLSVSALSPEQVALAMMQHGTQLCHGFFPYCPEMLVQDSGYLGDTGVSFTKGQRVINFVYPEARAGVASYSLDIWSRWLASHCFCVGGSNWYQLELLKNRDCFMFFRMTAVDEPVSGFSVRHAMDLPQRDEFDVVQSWKLKGGLKSNVNDFSSWESHSFLVRSRVVRRVREYAMQLDQQLFSRFAIKKQIRVVNNRFVVNGSTVSVAPMMTPLEVEDLTTAIFSQVFVMRYQSSRLSSEMMSALKAVSRFSSMATSERIAAVAWACTVTKLTEVMATLVGRVRDFADLVRDACGKGGIMEVSTRPAPRYLSLTSFSNEWRAAFTATGERLYRQREAFAKSTVSSTSMAGHLATAASRFSAELPSIASAGLVNVIRLCTSVVDLREARANDAATDQLVAKVREMNDLDSVVATRYELEKTVPLMDAQIAVRDFQIADDPDPAASLNSLYASVFPGVARQTMEYDTFSLSLDPQDRTLAAPYLRMPTYFGLPPNSRDYYRSRLMALNVPKRQNTSQELLSAISARNTAAPSVALPQEDILIKEIWENFLDTMCHSEARRMLLEFAADPVSMSEDGLREWAAKAKPGAVDRVKLELERNSRSLSQMNVQEYLVMLKADVKPTLSDKPLREMTAPQVIVYHKTELNALYSSIYRVLVRRFLALLRPGIFVNLLKDTTEMARFLSNIHPYGSSCRYLENDFSKYDKSQSQFAFDLEYYVFQMLGMNQEFLDQWLSGHVECSLRSISCGLSLHVLYQRKSGDATTAFGNVLLNVLSVAYAYKGTDVVWALFMGDDSLACARTVSTVGQPVQVLAEVFNLTAKYYITDAPYFASNFVLIDEARQSVQMVPDPIKRIERLSMHISAEDPQWDERFVSFKDSMGAYTDEEIAGHMSRLVAQRYDVHEGMVRASASALGTLSRSFLKFRALWAEESEKLSG